MSRIVGIVVVAYAACMLTACGSDDGAPRVHVQDAADLWSDDRERSIATGLQAIANEIGADVVVVTARDVDGWRLPHAADDAAAMTFDGAPDRDRDVTLFVTADPPLVQIRFGPDLATRAWYAGLDAGYGYRALQDAGPEPVQVGWALANAWSEAGEPGWFLQQQISAARHYAGGLVSSVAVPDMRAWYGLVHWVGSALVLPVDVFLTYPVALLILVAVLVAVGTRASRFIARAVIGAVAGPALGLLAGWLAWLAAMVLVAAPSLTLMALALSGRREDQLALSAVLGTDALSSLPPPGDPPSWWLILVLGIFVGAAKVLVQLVRDPLLAACTTMSPAAQARFFEQLPEDNRTAMALELSVRSAALSMDPDADALAKEAQQSLDRFEQRPFESLAEVRLHSGTQQGMRHLLAVIAAPTFLSLWLAADAFLMLCGSAIGWVRGYRSSFDSADRIAQGLGETRRAEAGIAPSPALVVTVLVLALAWWALVAWIVWPSAG